MALLLGMVAVLLALPALPKGQLDIDADRFLIERDANASLLLAYFGFPGCTDTCSVALARMGQLQAAARAAGVADALELAFVNLDSTSDPRQMALYLAPFDAAITAYNPDPAGIELIERKLGLTLRNIGGTISHADYFVLLRRDDSSGWRVLDRTRQLDPEYVLRLATAAPGARKATSS